MQNSSIDIDSDNELNQHENDDVVPAKSNKRYALIYNKFQKWKESNGTTSNSETVFKSYFEELANTKKPSSLYSTYSMLKTMMKMNEGIDISTYHNLSTFLKKKSAGYKPKKAKAFTAEEIERFLNDAPDETWLDVKVVCIFGICGARPTHELPLINVQHVKEYDDMYLVTPPATKDHNQQSFTITGVYFSIVKKYADLRPSHAFCDNFFLNYRYGKCTIQTIGKNKIFKMPQRIAIYLKLPEPERYTGHSLRNSSGSITGAMPRKRFRAGASNKGKTKVLKNSSVHSTLSTDSSDSSDDPSLDSSQNGQRISAAVTGTTVSNDFEICFVDVADPLGNFS